MRRDAIKARSCPQRQHPGNPAVVESRLCGQENADNDHPDHAGDGADRASDRTGQAADRPQQLGPDVGRTSPGKHPKASGKIHQAVELGRDDLAQGFKLGTDGRAGEPDDPAEESEAKQEDE